jgi:hypothetical protein
MSDSNLHERTAHIILDESLFPVVTNAPHEQGGGIMVLERNLKLILFLKTPERLRSRYQKIFVV